MHKKEGNYKYNTAYMSKGVFFSLKMSHMVLK